MKRNKKKLLLIGCLAGILMSTAQTPAVMAMYTAESAVNSLTLDGAVETRASQTQWVYKQINGKYYRRLYDRTLHKWLTDWIPC